MGRSFKGVEIPDEFDGLDDEFAYEFMQANGMVTTTETSDQKDDESAKTDDQQVNTETKEPSTNEAAETEEKSDTDTNASAGDTAPVKEPKSEADGKSEKMVPYNAVTEERKKRQTAQRELENLRAEIAQLRQQITVPQAGPQTTQQAAQKAEAEQTNQQQETVSERRQILNKAKQIFVKENNRDPEPYSDDDHEIALIAAEIREQDKAEKAEQMRVAQAVQRQAKSYTDFVQTEQQADDFEDVQAAFVENLKTMPDEEKEAFAIAFQRCQLATEGKGQCDPRDVYLVKKTWNEVAAKYRSAKTPTPPQAKPEQQPQKPTGKTVEDKLTELDKHPRSALVNGAKTTSANLAEIERLFNEMPWPEFEKKYPEYAKLLTE